MGKIFIGNRVMHIRTTMRYYLIPERIANINDATGEHVEKKVHSHTVGRNSTWYSH